MSRLVILTMMLMLLVNVGVVSAQDDVDVTVGDIPPLQQVTITYDATVNESLPEGLLFIENQGVATGTNFDPANSDDPRTTPGGDETLTPVGFTLTSLVALPNTGETPLWVIMLTSLAVALGVTGAVGGFVVYRRNAQRV